MSEDEIITTQLSEQSDTKPKKRKTKTLKQITTCFAPCGRCSYFWAGYRVQFGAEDSDTVIDSESGWLLLNWSRTLRDLVYKSYGSRLDVTFDHYQGCCQECQRHFIYQVENGTQPFSFRIELKPCKGK